MKRITETEIDARKTPAGGWTRKDLASWGVPWPPPVATGGHLGWLRKRNSGAVVGDGRRGKWRLAS